MLRDQVVVITGGSAGVGRATARAMAERGADVAVIGRGPDGLRGAVEEIRAAGRRALAVPTDVADYEQVTSATERIEHDLGPIAVWVNNAMTSVFAPFVQIRPEEFRRVTEVTYLGYVHGTMAVLPRMLSRGCGTIVQVGSALAYRAIPLQSAYCGAKHAVQGFSEAVRCELLHSGSKVRLTQVHLPALNTPQFEWVLSRLPRRAQPVPPIYQPEVAARMIVYAAEHPRRREYWVGTSTAATVLVQRLVPGVLDRYVARHAYDGQQTNEPDGHHPHNLWTAVPGDHGAHGRFDGRSHPRSPQTWLSRHRSEVIAAGALGVAVRALGWIRKARSDPW